jgi:hypothetical protein
VNAVQDRASLHEKAVQKIAKGEHVKPRRRRPRVSDGTKHGVSTTRVDPLVMAWLKRRKVDKRRVQILPSGEVVVWNHNHWKGTAEAVALAAKHKGHGPRKDTA